MVGLRATASDRYCSLRSLMILLGLLKIVFYADAYYAAPSSSELNDVLNKELQVLHDWIACNKLVLNIPKTKSILIGSRHKLSCSPKLYLKLNDVTIVQMESVKLLGVMFDSRLSFSNHLKEVCISRKCASFVARPLLCQIVQSLVLCHLSIALWSGHLPLKVSLGSCRLPKIRLHDCFWVALQDQTLTACMIPSSG